MSAAFQHSIEFCGVDLLGRIGTAEQLDDAPDSDLHRIAGERKLDKTVAALACGPAANTTWAL
ncbi:MAG: hypothetical protein ABIQ55_09345 [Gemmatimonadaceae bacterium]